MPRTKISTEIAAGRCQPAKVVFPARRNVPAKVEGVAVASGSMRAARQLNHNSSAARFRMKSIRVIKRNP